jgi:hypothetical protein
MKKINNIHKSTWNKKMSVFVLFLFAFCLSLRSQQINLIDKISGNYSNVKTFSIDISCQLDFVTGYDGPAFNSTGKIIKDGENYYSSIMGVTSITNDKYQYMMDEGQKIILIQNKAPLDYFQQFNMPFLSTEKLQDQYEFSFENVKKSILITITPKNDSKYKEIKVKVDSRKYFLQEVHSYYNIEKNLVIASHIYYTNSKFEQKVDQSFFDIGKYITIKNNKNVLTTPDYKKYELINYLNNGVK